MSGAGFRWNEWNLDHATKHGVTVAEIEAVAASGQPRYVGDGKYQVTGRGSGGRWVLVAVFLLDPPPERTLYVIHARPLDKPREKRRERKRRRGRS